MSSNDVDDIDHDCDANDANDANGANDANSSEDEESATENNSKKRKVDKKCREYNRHQWTNAEDHALVLLVSNKVAS